MNFHFIQYETSYVFLYPRASGYISLFAEFECFASVNIYKFSKYLML